MINFEVFKDSTQAIYFGMAEKYHVVGRYGGHKWHSFWLKDLDAREVFPLSTRLWLERLFEANTSMNWYNKTYIRTYCKHYKTLHCLPCCSNTFTRKYLDLKRDQLCKPILTSFTVVLH